MIVKWNNNIVDYKCKVFFFILFFYATNPSFFFFFFGLCKKKKKKENMQHMISGTHTINRSHQSCVTRVRTITPSRSRTRVSGAGGGRSNKERQRLQPLVSGARAPLFEVRRVRFTHRLYWHTHLLHWHPTVGINAPPEWRTTWVSAYRI